MAKRRKRSYGWLWAGGLFFSVGYLVTVLGIPPAPRATTSAPSRTAPATAPAPEAPRSPIYAVAALVALTIPFAAHARGMLRGLLRGLALSSGGAGGVAFGLGRLADRVRPEHLVVTTLLAAMTTLICCGITGAVFAMLAERRYRHLYGER